MSNGLTLATSGAPEHPLSIDRFPSSTDARMKKLSRLYFVGLVICLPLVASGQEKQRFANMDEAMQARGEPIAGIGPALGFRELKWLKPVYVGDTIAYKSEVIETRLSNSRPGSGLMTFRSTGVNQNGEPVISLVSITFVERRREKP